MDDMELSERYVALWNEPDPATRAEGVRSLWREDGRHLLLAPVEIRERADALGFPKATLEVRYWAMLAPADRVPEALTWTGGDDVRFES